MHRMCTGSSSELSKYYWDYKQKNQHYYSDYYKFLLTITGIRRSHFTTRHEMKISTLQDKNQGFV